MASALAKNSISVQAVYGVRLADDFVGEFAGKKVSGRATSSNASPNVWIHENLKELSD